MKRSVKVLFMMATIICTTLLYSCYAKDLVCASDKSDVEEFGDILHIALPVLALGSTFIAGIPDGKEWDREGTYQAMKSIEMGMITTDFFKSNADKLRPNERNRRSFVSGHASLAFSGAGFIDTRYGHMAGIPALLAAGFVGYSRIYADAHFADDVIGAMSVGLMSSWLFTTPQSQSRDMAVLPMMFKDGAGLSLTMNLTNTETGADSKKESSGSSDRRLRYDFAFGRAYLSQNEITAPAGMGATFDLNNFNKDEDPLTTAEVGLEFYLNDRHEISLFLWPFESRDSGLFSKPISFGGKTFPDNTRIKSAWSLTDARALWRYNLMPSEQWDLKVGGGLVYQELEVELSTADGSVATEVKDRFLLPFLHGSVGYQITPSWSLALEADGIYLSEDYMLDSTIFVNYHITDRWDISFRYKYYVRDIDTDALANRVIYNVPYVAVVFSWLKD